MTGKRDVKKKDHVTPKSSSMPVMSTDITHPNMNSSLIQLEDVFDYKIHTVDNIKKKMSEQVEQLCSILHLTIPHSIALLRYGRWKSDMILEQYMEDPVKYSQIAGIASPYEDILKSTHMKCPICFEDLNGNTNTISIPGCNHIYCTNCLRDYIKSKIEQSGGDVRRLNCCGTMQCRMILQDDLIKDLSSLETWNQYQYLSLKNFVQDQVELYWCPSPGCDTIIQSSYGWTFRNRMKRLMSKSVSNIQSKEDIDDQGYMNIIPIVECGNCHQAFCLNCGNNDHLPAPCNILKKWIQKCSDDSETANWISVNTKDCPFCSSTIEKNGGCNHMTCKSCKNDFCWICLDKWSSHKDNYNCNRYPGNNPEPEEPNIKQSSSKKKKSEKDDVKLSVARQALDRYLHHYTRYANHLQSLKLESLLMTLTEKKMEQMQSQTDLTWIDLDFLRNAVKNLLKCRNTLAHSYAFAYYATRSNYTEIFEDNQRDLELAVENLSRLIEHPVMKPHVSLMDWKQKVLNTSVYVITRREKLLQDVKTGLIENRFVFSG